jgi:hypothetical protein
LRANWISFSFLQQKCTFMCVYVRECRGSIKAARKQACTYCTHEHCKMLLFREQTLDLFIILFVEYPYQTTVLQLAMSLVAWSPFFLSLSILIKFVIQINLFRSTCVHIIDLSRNYVACFAK